MHKIEIVIAIPNEEEEYEAFLLDTVRDSCEFLGCDVKSILISGGEANISKEFIKNEDVIEGEFVELLEYKNKDVIQ